MPVVAGSFIPTRPMTAAEETVAWAKTNRVILEQREQVEQAAFPAAKQLGLAVGYAWPGLAAPRERLTRTLSDALAFVYGFGRTEARRELVALRSRSPIPITAATRRDTQPGAARRRFDMVAQDAADAVERAAREAAGDPVSASTAAARQLHLEVLEAVGTALNLGRTAGAMSAPGGPPTYALRSEQLDRNSCPRCIEVHGTIVQADTPDYYALLPPAQCFGGGRCRGVMVFADGVRDLSPAQAPDV
jgi:hypothetical protein